MLVDPNDQVHFQQKRKSQPESRFFPEYVIFVLIFAASIVNGVFVILSGLE